jgi:DNA polymerase-3 subunit alpha
MYFPLHVHSHYSLLDGLSKPSDIVSRCKEIGVAGSALTDHGNLAGSVAFTKAMKKAGLKSILGCELYICKEHASVKKGNKQLNHLVVLAKNQAGWKNLIHISSKANDKDNFYYKPRLSLEQLDELVDGNLIAFSGHLGSDLAEAIFEDYTPEMGGEGHPAYNAPTYEDAKQFIHPEWIQRCTDLINKYVGIFGEGNFFLEIQLIDQDQSPCQKITAEALRYLSKKLGVPCVATPDAHYARREDAEDQRVLLCNLLETTFPAIKTKMMNGEYFAMSTFFKSDSYHIPSYEEMREIHTEEELENTLKIADMCEEYEILREPVLPQFPCPDGLTPPEYLRQLCREGWAEKIADHVDESLHQEYADRIKQELDVLQGAGLSSYFLIVRDIVDKVRSKSWIPGPGRGSAAGCLVSYLIGITSIDPIKYGLIFERFYNAGRNTGGRVSMPDIDIDVPVSKRDEIISYIKEQYGAGRVAQMITFQTMMGRGAIKDVLRAYGSVAFEEMNLITKNIPDKAEIAEALQDMKEETGTSSVIRWALENEPEKFKEWCQLDEEGNLQGRLAKRFEQAIRLEGTKRSQSKHAAGVVIAPLELDEICPMVLDTKAKVPVGGLEMQDMEDIGMIKFDILGIAMLDKIMGVRDILELGDVRC